MLFCKSNKLFPITCLFLPLFLFFYGICGFVVLLFSCFVVLLFAVVTMKQNIQPNNKTTKQQNNKRHSLFLESMMMVTGPSLSSSTFMSAPNSPVPTSLPIAVLNCWQKAS